MYSALLIELKLDRHSGKSKYIINKLKDGIRYVVKNLSERKKKVEATTTLCSSNEDNC